MFKFSVTPSMYPNINRRKKIVNVIMFSIFIAQAYRGYIIEDQAEEASNQYSQKLKEYETLKKKVVEEEWLRDYIKKVNSKNMQDIRNHVYRSSIFNSNAALEPGLVDNKEGRII
jgi:hypothetical protein